MARHAAVATKRLIVYLAEVVDDPVLAKFDAFQRAGVRVIVVRKDTNQQHGWQIVDPSFQGQRSDSAQRSKSGCRHWPRVCRI